MFETYLKVCLNDSFHLLFVLLLQNIEELSIYVRGPLTGDISGITLVLN